MDQIITSNIWSRVARLLQKRSKKTAALAYVSKGASLMFATGDMLVCDASDPAVKAGQTDAETLNRFFHAGASLFSCENLHAKVLVSGDLTVIGSANLSSSAENILVEASLVTKRPQIRSQALALVHNIMRASTPIDAEFIAHIRSLPVTRRPRSVASRKKSVKLKELGKRYWIVNTSPVSVIREEEEELIEQGEEQARNLLRDPEADIYWMRWTGRSRFRQLAKPGDTVIEITRHKRRSSVANPRAVLFRQPHAIWSRFYLENQTNPISWTKFENELKKLGLKDKITKNSVRELVAREIALLESILATKRMRKER